MLNKGIRRTVSLCALLVLLVLSGYLAGCGSGTGQSGEPGIAGAVRIGIDAAQAERLLAFYIGSYLGAEGGDPAAAGLLEKRENSWYLRDPSGNPDAHPALSDLFGRFRDAGTLPQDSLEAFLAATYYSARSFPSTLEAFRGSTGDWAEPDWFQVEVQGSMVTLPRRTWVRRASIASALDGTASLDEPVIYPVGTVFVGEHVDGERVVETTVMQKRGDGYWDYWVYDEAGNLTDRVHKEPRDLIVPIRCTGCHYGDRSFEPERSFPSEARPGPAGPRTILVPESWRNADIAVRLNEHARRSDTVLGLYATLYLAQAAAGQGDAVAEALLGKFGIELRTP